MDDEKEKPLKLRPDTIKGFSYVWSAKVSHTRTYAESDDPISDESTGIKCGVCGSNKLILIYKDYYANLSGSSGNGNINVSIAINTHS